MAISHAAYDPLSELLQLQASSEQRNHSEETLLLKDLLACSPGVDDRIVVSEAMRTHYGTDVTEDMQKCINEDGLADEILTLQDAAGPEMVRASVAAYLSAHPNPGRAVMAGMTAVFGPDAANRMLDVARSAAP